jgi:enoyl-CoA hydratase/carnithine racemase
MDPRTAPGMDHGLVLAERRDAVLLLTLNRPHRLNAWTDAMEDRYFELLDLAESDPAVRAVVVTGAGRGFCAGADLDDLERVSDRLPPVLARPRPRHRPLLLGKPLIAAINGAAAGLGLVEALYCDVRFAVRTAKLTTAFAQRGLIAEYGVAWLLPRLVGTSRSLDLLLSARVVTGTEAAQIGLVDHLVDDPDDLLPRALAYAEQLAAHCSPRSMQVIKSQVLSALDTDFETAAREAERLMLEAFAGADLGEGVRSFREGRAPVFRPLP